METRYKALRFIGTVYKVLGGITGVLTLLIAIGYCGFMVLLGGASGLGSNSSSSALGGLLGGGIVGVIVSIIILLEGGIVALALYGGGEMIYLLISLEENTRATAQSMQARPAQTPPAM